MVVLELIRSLLTRMALLALRAYQRIVSPILPRVCRFTPSCSQYMIDAIHKKGLLVGILKGTLRLLRCNPLFPGGHDPVR
jgi:putative membrane protein insertion efficiency factor